MKHFLMIPALILLWTGSAGAVQQAATVTLPTADYKAILSELQALKSRVETLEGESQSPSGKQATAAIPGRVEKDIESIYDTLDQVETKSLKDKINFGAEVRTRVDNFEVKNHQYFSNGSMGSTESNDNSWTNRFRLNMDAKIRKNLTFTGRLTAYKNFADSDSIRSGIIGDSNQAHLPDGSSIKLDRAYIDWVPEGLAIPLAVTFGRHPSSEGPPFEMKENRKRQSTYPALLFDGEADGVVVTLGLDRYLGLNNSGLRFAYGKAYQDDDDVNSYLDNPSGINDTNVFAAFFETEIPTVPNSLLVLSALRANDLAADFSNAGIGMSNAANLGDVDLFGIHAQANKVMKSNLDFFVSLGLNQTHPDGGLVGFDLNRSGTIDPGEGMGLLNNDGTTSHQGWSVYTGLRYTIPSAKLNNPKIGFEYNHGSEYWFSFTSGSTELYNKLATRGNAYDFYYIQPFNDNLYARIGYTLIDYDYSLSGFHIGDFGPSTEELRNGYMMLDCRF